ncbi:MAG: hypothetical protein JWM80_1201 [Cyanobacteria bacterium RYN_339]|nr:hypothetical protein [Cyanobacteria bacterium RYN_339]
MNPKYILALALGGATLVALGCVASPPVVQAPDEGTVTLVVMPRVGGDRQLQAVIKPYGPGDINHLDVQLWANAAQVGLTKTINGNPNGNAVSFVHLHKGTDYTIKAFAYKSADNSLKISVDASSTSAFTTKVVAGGDQDQPVTSGVPVVLIDQTFDGTASGAVTVTGGTVKDTTATEAIL